MEYKGKLYAKIANKYLEISHTDEYEKLETQVKELKHENKMLERTCTRAQDVAEELLLKNERLCLECGNLLTAYDLSENFKVTKDLQYARCYSCTVKSDGF